MQAPGDTFPLPLPPPLPLPLTRYLISLKTREDINAATVKEVQERQQFLAQSYTSLGNLDNDI